MFKEFKEFALKGSLLDLAIGFVLGGAFGRIVSSFVSDVLMPPLGLLLGKVDFNALFIDLSGQGFPTLAAAREAGAATINYGIFLSAVIDFLLVALALFLVVKQVNKLRRATAEAPVGPAMKECPFCLSSVQAAAARCPYCTSTLN